MTQAFPGTDDHRTVEDVDRHIKDANAYQQCPMCGDMGGPEYWSKCRAATCEMRDGRAAQEVGLPPLPDPVGAILYLNGEVWDMTSSAHKWDALVLEDSRYTKRLLYTADQMREYARTAIAAAGGGAPQATAEKADEMLLGIHRHLQEALRIPTMPWPDPGAHGHEATARAIHTSYCALRFKVMDAIAELTSARVELTGLLASSPQPEAAPADDVLEALELSPETFRTEGGVINKGKLRAAILHPYNYLPPDHWMQARFSKPGGRPLSEAAPAVAQVPSEEVVLIDGVPVPGLLPEDREPLEALVKAAYVYAERKRAAAPEAPAQADPLEKLTRLQEEMGLYNEAPAQRCPYCDDTGDVHTPTGEWRGRCTCPAGTEAPAQADEGHVVVCWNHDRTRILAVTRQNTEGQILKVIAEAPAQAAQSAGEVERDRRDAARYRWLRETMGYQVHGQPSIEAAWDDDIDDYRSAWFFGLNSPEAIDAAIDAALQSKEQP